MTTATTTFPGSPERLLGPPPTHAPHATPTPPTPEFTIQNSELAPRRRPPARGRRRSHTWRADATTTLTPAQIADIADHIRHRETTLPEAAAAYNVSTTSLRRALATHHHHFRTR